MGPRRVQAGLSGCPFHSLPHSLPGDVQHRAVAVLGVERGQISQALQQVRRNRDLPAFAGLVPRGLRPDGDHQRVWDRRRPERRSERASDTRRPVLSMIRKAMRVG